MCFFRKIVCHVAMACVLMIAVPQLPSAWAQKRIAIVVGIDIHDNLRADQQLKKAVNDANSVGDALTTLGFEVLRGENVRRLEFNRLWQRFLNRIAPGDTVAFFFAGHGIEIGGANFLLARDVPLVASGEHELLKGEAIWLSRLVDDLRVRQPKVSVLILDACRDNPFPQPGGRSVGSSRGLARVEAPEGMFVMFSAGTGEAALDRLTNADRNVNSVYTRRLIPLITRQGLSLPDLAQEVRRQVRRLAASVRHRQTPAYYDEVIGRFCLAGCEPNSTPGQVAVNTPVVPRERPFQPPRIMAPDETLPADLPVHPAVVKTIETHPFFANAPPVQVGKYRIFSTTSSTTSGGAGTMTNASNDTTTVRWLRKGVVRMDLSQHYTVKNNGSVGNYELRSASVSAANGLFTLSYKAVFDTWQSSGRRRKANTTSQLLRIENMTGRIFPLAVGNSFSYRLINRWKSSIVRDSEYVGEYSCEVTKRYDAASFHAALNGSAYLLVCDGQSTDGRTKAVTKSQSRDFFFDDLGVWLRVDPVFPKEQIVMNNVTSIHGDYITVSNGIYTLKSFALAR